MMRVQTIWSEDDEGMDDVVELEDDESTDDEKENWPDDDFVGEFVAPS